MKQRPILFNGEMVRQILAGNKTQTRRPIKTQPDGNGRWAAPFGLMCDIQEVRHYNPFGSPGDLLYVRETWKFWGWTEDGMPHIQYRADESVQFIDGHRIPDDFVGSGSETWGERLTGIWAELSKDMSNGRACDRGYRSSIHMPKWAARIWLRVTDVRVERVQDITDEDAYSEGIPTIGPMPKNIVNARGRISMPVSAFVDIWESAYPGSWERNEWVWVVEFERTEAPNAE